MVFAALVTPLTANAALSVECGTEAGGAIVEKTVVHHLLDQADVPEHDKRHAVHGDACCQMASQPAIVASLPLKLSGPSQQHEVALPLEAAVPSIVARLERPPNS